MFGAELSGVTPDIIVLGKGLGAGLPLACILIHEKLEGFGPHADELHTFASPTLSMVASAKMISLLEGGVLENCRVQGDYLARGLRDMQTELPEMGDIRQAGLHIGVEFVDDPRSKKPLLKETTAIRDAGLKRGIIFGLGGARKNVLKVKPPLIVNQNECDEILEKVRLSARDVLRR